MAGSGREHAVVDVPDVDELWWEIGDDHVKELAWEIEERAFGAVLKVVSDMFVSKGSGEC